WLYCPCPEGLRVGAWRASRRTQSSRHSDIAPVEPALAFGWPAAGTSTARKARRLPAAEAVDLVTRASAYWTASKAGSGYWRHCYSRLRLPRLTTTGTPCHGESARSRRAE